MWVYIYQSWVEKELLNAYIGEYPPIPTTYTPNENTLLYIPMKKDLLDYSGKDVVVNNNNLATVDTSILSSWMWVWNFSSWPLTINIWGIEIKSPFTISMRVYIPNFVYRGSYGIFNLWWISMSYWPSGKYSSYIYIGGQTFSASVLEWGWWINFIIRYNWSVCNLLSNLTSSWNQTITVSGWPTSTISNICSYVWYMSDLIYENSYWSDAQCAEYHNNSSQYYS